MHNSYYEEPIDTHLQSAVNMTISVNLTSREHRTQTCSMLRTTAESQLLFNVSPNKTLFDKIRGEDSWEHDKIK